MWMEIYWNMINISYSIPLIFHCIDVHCIKMHWLKSVWISACSNLLLSALCLGNRLHSHREPGLPPVALPCGHLSQGPPANTHRKIRNHNVEVFEKLKAMLNIRATHTLDIKIPNCEALPPRMLKPSCAPGGFFNTIVRGRNWVSSLL